MGKPRYFAIVAHCLLNPATRVHILGRRYTIADCITHYLLSKNISIIQLPCPEFTAMGYWRNPQGRQQYDNVFFRKHCKKELESYIDMITELYENDNTPFCFIGIEGSPTCSIRWGKHKQNKYKTESILPVEEDEEVEKYKTEEKSENVQGVMTGVLEEMLKERGINFPFVEAPVKDNIHSDKVLQFFSKLDDILGVPEAYRDYSYLEKIEHPQNKEV